ncbi:MAG: pimeloyl-ACP methyl ester carboxylesterase [Chlamydiales bacterium]|jgi:pimeloyl-ACP methyl ester carboxylesterase
MSAETTTPDAGLETRRAHARKAAGILGDEYPFEPHFVAVDGGWMHTVDEGPRKDAPVLLALHGNPTWSYFYRNVVKAFAPDMRVVAPDHIGCGLSDKPQRWSYSLEAHVANIVRLIERLDLSNITLMVHDWGGAIGMGAALRVPERIERLVVMNTAAFPAPSMPLRIRACRTPLLGRWVVQGLNAFAGAATVMAVEKPLAPEIKRGFLFPYDSYANRIATWRFVDDIPMSARHRSFATLDAIGKGLETLTDRPMCMLWGERDWCFTPSYRAEWQKRFPDAQVHAIERAGHYLLEDAGEEVIGRVRSFLEQHSPRTASSV